MKVFVVIVVFVVVVVVVGSSGMGRQLGFTEGQGGLYIGSWKGRGDEAVEER